MRHLLFALSFICLTCGSAVADGASQKKRTVSLPAPQPSVAVTVERGVRVWRPLGTTGGFESGPVWPVRYSNARSDYYAVPFYGAPIVGLAGGFGGYGSRHGMRGQKWRGHGFAHARAGGSWGHAGGSRRMAFGGPRHGGRPGGHGHR